MTRQTMSIRPEVGAQYIDVITGLIVEVRAVAKGYVVCNQERVYPMDSFHRVFTKTEMFRESRASR